VKYVLYVLLVVNLTAFLAYGLDKWLAVRGLRRISERRLLQLTTWFGGLGAYLGSRLFHHKTRKTSFLWRMRLALLFNVLALAALVWAWKR